MEQSSAGRGKPVERVTSATPEQVWAVLADGWTFGSWVVGASRVRAVEESWPSRGRRVHHSVGSWPAVIDDETLVVESEPNRRLVLQARIRPLGEARVEITLEPTAGGTRLTMSEDFTNGPGSLVPRAGRQAGLRVRNAEALHRLALMAERRTRPER